MLQAAIVFACALGVSAHYVHEGTHFPGERPLPYVNGTNGAAEWEWHYVEGTQCMDKRQSGFWIRHGDSDKLMFYMMGGGACFNAGSCLQVTEDPQGFNPPPSTGILRPNGAGSEYDNPVGDHTVVFLPYCTGDVFFGNQDEEKSYGIISSKKRIYKGRDLVERVFQSLQDDTLIDRSLNHFILTGESAGGFGSIANYDFIRKNFISDKTSSLGTHWTLDRANGARSLLIDDSGVVMNANHLTPCLTKYWYNLFNLGTTLPAGCTGCDVSLYKIYDFLKQEYPNDVMAFISTNMDEVIDLFYSFGFQAEDKNGECGSGLLPPGQTPGSFQDGVEAFFLDHVIGAGVNTNMFASYFFPGTDHTHSTQDSFFYKTTTFNDLDDNKEVKLVDWYREIVSGVAMDVEHALFETSHLTNKK